MVLLGDNFAHLAAMSVAQQANRKIARHFNAPAHFKMPHFLHDTDPFHGIEIVNLNARLRAISQC
jgi:hypothetical protein